MIIGLRVIDFGLILGLFFVLAVVGLADPPPPGAISTATFDGRIVDVNVGHRARRSVYLEGGPGPNASSTVAGLSAGDYYFQVTDPSGKDLLSSDHISCRKIHVGSTGVIDIVYPGINYVKDAGELVESPCLHAEGADIGDSALTVKLFPYDSTSYQGRVYKAWITLVDDYDGRYNGNDAYLPGGEGKDTIPVNGESFQPDNLHGFIPANSKTVNYKIRRRSNPFDAPVITIRNFHDANFDGIQDEGELDIAGWQVIVTDPSGVTNFESTKSVILAAVPGDYTVVEQGPARTLQTVSSFDGVTLSQYPKALSKVDVTVTGDSGEVHEVIYGSVGLESIEACNVYDQDGDGQVDEDEPAVAGWKMQLTGTDARDANVGPIVQTTDENGCTTFGDLLPGIYTVSQIPLITGGWIETGPSEQIFEIISSLVGPEVVGTIDNVSFTNACLSSGVFGTTEYWQKEDGMTELANADIIFMVGLPTYSAPPSAYFQGGDEPFDGLFTDQSRIEVAQTDSGEELAPAGSAKAEVFHFLADPNDAGDRREQLAQQLLAFILNTRHRMDSLKAAIELPDGNWATGQSLIDRAVATWQSVNEEQHKSMASLLSTLNNNLDDGDAESIDKVTFIRFKPCEVAYP